MEASLLQAIPRSSNRTQLLDAAETLMLESGYCATSVERICSEAGVTKGSFFHHFKNKEELGKVLLGRFGARQAEFFAAACDGIDDPLERVFTALAAASRASQEPEMKGCLIGSLAQELWDTRPELMAVCRANFEGFANSVGADLTVAKQEHCPDADFDPATLGAYLLSVLQGSMLLLRTNGDRAAMAANIAHARDYLARLYGRGPQASIEGTDPHHKPTSTPTKN